MTEYEFIICPTCKGRLSHKRRMQNMPLIKTELLEITMRIKGPHHVEFQKRLLKAFPELQPPAGTKGRNAPDVMQITNGVAKITYLKLPTKSMTAT